MEDEKFALGLNPDVVLTENPSTTDGITFSSIESQPWIMRLTPEGKIEFNREAYPSFCPDDFAREVVKCLEMHFVRYKIL